MRMLENMGMDTTGMVTTPGIMEVIIGVLMYIILGVIFGAIGGVIVAKLKE